MSDALVDTLEMSIEKDAKEVMIFVKSAQDNLSQNPQSAEEIEAMHKEAMEIGMNKDKY